MPSQAFQPVSLSAFPFFIQLKALPMKTYKILWIDDQYETLDNFQLKAERNGILLEGFKSFEEGFAYLDSHLNEFSGVLLDARFFSGRADETGDETLKGLSLAVSRLDQLHPSEKLPWFILSGQADLERNSFFSETYGKYYVKFNELSEQALFAAIKDAADKLVHTRIRHRYADVFSVFTPQLLGEGADVYLLQILECLAEPAGKPEADSYFNQLRKLIEAFLFGLHRHQLLPDQCQEGGKFNLTYSRLFLTGSEVRPHNGTPSFKARQVLLPAVLVDALQRLIELTNNGSHFQHDAQITPGQRQATEAKLTQLRQRVKTPYLLASLTYQLLDLLVWLKSLLDSADVATYKQAWDVAPLNVAAGSPAEIAGKIKRIVAGGSAFFIADADNAEAYIPKRLVDAHLLTVGQAVRVVLDTRPPSSGNSLPTVSQFLT
jgi:hypothetical protein